MAQTVEARDVTMISRRALIGGGATLAFSGCARHLGVPSGMATGDGAPPPQVVGYGPTIADPACIFDLPEGFSYRIISRAGERMDDGLVVPGKMDGMGCFDLGGGRVALVRNHELKPTDHRLGAYGEAGSRQARAFDHDEEGRPWPGGTTTLVYDMASGRTLRQHLSLAGTAVNCAGGATPWGSWLSCEETTVVGGEAHGYVFEVPAAATTLVAPRPLTGLGRFRHEAAAIDPATGIVYLTEDQQDGLFYRFIPARPGRLAEGGRLQALALADGTRDTRNFDGRQDFAPRAWKDVRWIDMDGTDAPDDDLRLRGAAAGAALFARGEGVHFGRGELYFTCTSGGAAQIGQIMRYVPGRAAGEGGRIQNFLESTASEILDFGDNVVVTPWNHLIVCEDKYTDLPDNRLRGVTPAGSAYMIGRNVHPLKAETAGVCFSPDGSTMFLNIYAPGYTLAITGPWTRFDDRPLV